MNAVVRILNESWVRENPETAAQNLEFFDPSKHPALRFGNRMLSPWFKGTERPVRPGVYRRRALDSVDAAFGYWDGEQWYAGGNTPEEAARYYYDWRRPTRLQPRNEHDYPTEWQGLLSEFLTPSYFYDNHGYHE